MDLFQFPGAVRRKFNPSISIYCRSESQVPGNRLPTKYRDDDIRQFAGNILACRSIHWNPCEVDGLQQFFGSGPNIKTIKPGPDFVEGHFVYTFEMMTLDDEDRSIFWFYPYILAMRPSRPQVIAINKCDSLTPFSCPEDNGLVLGKLRKSFLVRTKEFQFGASLRIEGQNASDFVIRVLWQPPNALQCKRFHPWTFHSPTLRAHRFYTTYPHKCTARPAPHPRALTRRAARGKFSKLRPAWMPAAVSGIDASGAIPPRPDKEKGTPHDKEALKCTVTDCDAAELQRGGAGPDRRLPG